MEVHVGNGNKESKSEILFCAAPPHCYLEASTYDGADLSHVRWADGSHMPVVLKFKYLGSIIASDGKDVADVDARLDAATEAFGMLRKGIFASKAVSTAAKHFVYLAVVMSILLYGSECWSLTEAMMHKLRCFHARCARSMNRIILKQCYEHSISTDSLLSKFQLESVDTYVKCRQLRWLGHVRRMPFDRLPRKMLSSWCTSKRPKGAPQMTYGRTINKALKYFHIDRSCWPEFSSCKHAWRDAIGGTPTTTAKHQLSQQQQQNPRPQPQSQPQPERAAVASSRCGRPIRIPARYL